MSPCDGGVEAPKMKRPEAISELLRAQAEGDHVTVTRLFPVLYEELHLLAHRQLARQGRRDPALNTTALVHEAFLKLRDHSGLPLEDRTHFFSLAARAMRQIVIDYARRFGTAKRGGGAALVTLDEEAIGIEQQADRLLALDELLGRLEVMDERLARVVECRFFAGLTEEETAEALGTSLRTVQRDWLRARGWLRADLEA